jgi:hypothetical protein
MKTGELTPAERDRFWLPLPFALFDALNSRSN